MPIYDYHCRKCGHRFEQLVKPDETPHCPSCHAANPERQFAYSAAVSTTRTRGKALAVARSMSKSIKKEKDVAHAEYLRKHEEDHR